MGDASVATRGRGWWIVVVVVAGVVALLGLQAVWRVYSAGVVYDFREPELLMLGVPLLLVLLGAIMAFARQTVAATVLIVVGTAAYLVLRTTQFELVAWPWELGMPSSSNGLAVYQAFDASGVVGLLRLETWMPVLLIGLSVLTVIVAIATRRRA